MVLELVARLFGNWEVLETKAYSSKMALALGIGEGKFVGASKGVRVQTSLTRVESFKGDECKILWHLVLVKEVLVSL